MDQAGLPEGRGTALRNQGKDVGDGEVRRGLSGGVETLSRSAGESSRTERNWDKRREFSGRTW